MIHNLIKNEESLRTEFYTLPLSWAAGKSLFKSLHLKTFACKLR